MKRGRQRSKKTAAVRAARAIKNLLHGQILAGDTQQIEKTLQQFPGRRAIVILVDEDASGKQVAGLFEKAPASRNGQDVQAALRWIEENAVELPTQADTSLENMYSGTLDDPR